VSFPLHSANTGTWLLQPSAPGLDVPHGHRWVLPAAPGHVCFVLPWLGDEGDWSSWKIQARAKQNHLGCRDGRRALGEWGWVQPGWDPAVPCGCLKPGGPNLGIRQCRWRPANQHHLHAGITSSGRAGLRGRRDVFPPARVSSPGRGGAAAGGGPVRVLSASWHLPRPRGWGDLKCPLLCCKRVPQGCSRVLAGPCSGILTHTHTHTHTPPRRNGAGSACQVQTKRPAELFLGVIPRGRRGSPAIALGVWQHRAKHSGAALATPLPAVRF